MVLASRLTARHSRGQSPRGSLPGAGSTVVRVLRGLPIKGMFTGAGAALPGVFSISVGAELTGLHPHTMRIYEREGSLIRRAAPRGEGIQWHPPGLGRWAGVPATAWSTGRSGPVRMTSPVHVGGARLKTY